MKKIKFLLAIVALVIVQTSLMSQLSVSTWEIHEGNEGVVSHSNPRNGDPSAYTKAKIPAENDRGWSDAPTNSAGDVSIDRSSTVDCLNELDFTYFQTSVNIPSNTTVNEFNVSYDKADDGARIYIFNSKFPSGKFDSKADLIISDNRDNTGNVDLKSLITTGNNRIVIVQFDDCADRNTVKGIRVKVNGQEIEPEEDDEAVATLYEHGNYTGDTHVLDEENTSGVPIFGHDIVSSVKVKKGWKVTLFEHYDPNKNAGYGRKLVLTSDTPELWAKEHDFNDITSFVTIERASGASSSAPVELPDKFKVLAFSVNEGKADLDSYWFALNNGDSRGRILSQKKLGANAKWMEIETIEFGNDIYAFKVMNAGTDMYLTARDNKEVHVEKAAGGNLPEGAKFKRVAPLTTAPGASVRHFHSFQSVKFANHYLRHSGFAMFVHTTNNTELFKQDASWLIEKMK